MDEEFSDIFKKVNNPIYTACVAVILFNELQRCKLINAKNVAVKYCCWSEDSKDFKVPNDYTPDTNPINNIGHCLYPIYGYTCNYPSTNYFTNYWIKKLCKAADCTGKSSPRIVHEKIVHWVKKCLRYYPIDSPKSVKSKA